MVTVPPALGSFVVLSVALNLGRSAPYAGIMARGWTVITVPWLQKLHSQSRASRFPPSAMFSVSTLLHAMRYAPCSHPQSALTDSASYVPSHYIPDRAARQEGKMQPYASMGATVEPFQVTSHGIYGSQLEAFHNCSPMRGRELNPNQTRVSVGTGAGRI